MKKMGKGKENLIPLYFAMTERQHKRLHDAKKESFCKIMYLLRYAAYYIANNDDKITPFDSQPKVAKYSKGYKVDLPKHLYKKLEKISKEKKVSMSRIMRTAINETLFLK